MGFLSYNELLKLNFKQLGQNVQISDKASLYGCEYMEIGDNVRIDDFCVLSGKIIIGNNVHIALQSIIMSGTKHTITIDDYVSISFGCKIFSKTDDFSGNFMTNPTVPKEFTNVTERPIHIKKHTIIGAGSSILNGVTLEEGTAIGMNSIVNRNTNKWTIYMGNPIKKISERHTKALTLESIYKENA